MKSPKIEDFNELFRFETQISLLHSEFFASGALKQGDILVISDEKSWNTFIDKQKEKECLKTGLELFSSQEKYEAYSRNFRFYLEKVAPPIISKYSQVPDKFAKDELEKLFKDLLEFWYIYEFTEHSFHDLAYEEMTKKKNLILEKNLSDLGKLKFDGREVLNSYMFKGGVLHNILDALSRQFLKGNDAYFLFSWELLGLFSDKRVDQKIINNRKRCYAFAVNRGALEEYGYTDAKKILADFTKSNKDIEIKGMVANKGKITGKVIIAPMLNDQEKVEKIVAKMSKGDILVAQTTSPEYIALCKLAGAIVTDQGGMLSHAAIVSRELNIPCIVGTKIATRVFKDGDLIEVDADKGVVKIAKR